MLAINIVMLYYYKCSKQRNKKQRKKTTYNTPQKQRKALTSKGAQIKFKGMNKMNEQKYNDLKTNIKLAFEKDTEISKGIKKALSELSEHFEATIQDVLFVTMKEFTNEYKTGSALQFYHYLSNIKYSDVANMLNFLELTRY